MQYFSINIDGNFDVPLTGSQFNMTEIDLAYLYFIIESKYKIVIDPRKIVNYEFNSINGIINIIRYSKQ